MFTDPEIPSDKILVGTLFFLCIIKPSHLSKNVVNSNNEQQHLGSLKLVK